MNKFHEENNQKDSVDYSHQNQFLKMHNQIAQPNQQEDNTSYPPLCLDSNIPQSRYTPISQLSSAIYYSSLRVVNQADKNQVNYSSDNHGRHCNQNKQENKQDFKFQLKHLSSVLSDMKCYTTVLEKRNEQLVILLQKQKIKSSHFQQALNIIRKQDLNLDKKLNQQAQIFSKLRQQYESQKDKNLILSQKIQQISAENNYFKELILIANNNYQIIQKKYLSLVQRTKKIEQQSLQKQKQISCNMHEMKNLLTNIINSPSNHSTLNPNMSFGQQDQNFIKRIPFASTNRNQKKQVQDIYRKMFIKTLKGKK